MSSDGWTTVNSKGTKSKKVKSNTNQKFKDVIFKEENIKEEDTSAKEASDLIKEERKRQSILKKQKLKEEKKYKREQRLREEQERRRRDTKVKVISQNDLLQSSKSHQNSNYQSSQNNYFTNLNEYPTLGTKTHERNSYISTAERLSSPILNNWVNNNNNVPQRECVGNKQSVFNHQTSTISHDKAIITTRTDKAESSKSSSTNMAPTYRKKVKTKDLINLDIMDLIELKKKTEASKTKVPIRPPQNLPEKVERRGKVSLAKKKLTTLKKNQMRQKQVQEESKKEAADLFSVLNEASQNSETIIKLNKPEEDRITDLNNGSPLNNDDCNENDRISVKVENIDTTIERKNEENHVVTDELINDLKNLMNPIHSRKFREYCNHILNPEIDKNLKELVEMVVSFHQRLYYQDPVKAKMRRRYYCGLREALKHMNSVKCLVIAPNLKPSPGKGCLDELVNKVVSSASERGVTTIFGLSDRILGKLCHRKVPVGCVSLINIQGAQEKFEKLMELLPDAREQYENLSKKQIAKVS